MHNFKTSGIAVALATLAALGLAAHPAQAQSAYVYTSDAAFGLVNLQTGAYTELGSGGADLFALGYGADGQLYGLGPDGGNGTELYSVSTKDGSETSLTDFANFEVNGGSTDASGVFSAISVADSHEHSSLFYVDPIAETATGGLKTLAAGDGLAVPDNQGNVYVSDNNVNDDDYDNLDVLAPSGTKESTAPIGDTELNDVYTGLFSDGQLYTFGSSNNNEDSIEAAFVSPLIAPVGGEGIYTLDTNSGASTFVAPFNGGSSVNVYASALAPLSATPEPSSVAVLAFGILGMAGLVLKARKRSQSA